MSNLNINEAKWENNFQDLVAYKRRKEENETGGTWDGTVQANQPGGDGRFLGQWVKRQRYNKRLKRQRKEKLTTLGLKFGSQEEKWQLSYTELVTYSESQEKECNGTVDV